MKDLLDRTIAQGIKLEELSARTHNAQARLRESSDRVFFSLQDAFTFQQGQNTVQNLVFNVPGTDDFEAVRLSVYPFIRKVNLSIGSQSDVTFRPTVWSFQNVSASLVRYSVDALMEMTVAYSDGKTRSCQNAAFLASQVFSAYTSPVAQENEAFLTIPPPSLGSYDRSESPSALVFDPCWVLPKGSTVTLRITPLFSGERDVDYADSLINEYQLRGVLEGYKRAR